MRTAALLTSALLLGGIAGCTDEAPPSTLPPVSVAPSPTVAAAVPVPSAATAETPQGAAAFARYYMDLLTRGFDASDASAIRAVSASDCTSCNNYIGAIEEPPTPGERVVGGAFRVEFAEAAPTQTENALVDLRYTVAEIRVLNDAGQVLRTTPPEPAIDAQMLLSRRDGGWIVRQLVSS